MLGGKKCHHKDSILPPQSVYTVNIVLVDIRMNQNLKSGPNIHLSDTLRKHFLKIIKIE